MVRLAHLLLVVGLLDELAGVAFVATPDLRGELGLTHALALGALFAVPTLVSSAADPLVLLAAHLLPAWRRAMVTTGLLVQGVALVAASMATGFAQLAAATTLMFVASTAGTGLAETALVDGAEDDHEVWMARWAAMGAVGDLAAPLVLAAAAAAGLGWRVSLALVGGAFVAYAGVLATRRFPVADDDEDEGTLRESFAAALGNRRLVAWLVGAALCSMLDETFVALAALHLEHAHGADTSTRGLLLALLTGSTMTGLAVSERLLAAGADPIRLLRLSSASAALGLLAWCAAPNLAAAAIGLMWLGVSVGPMWPIAMARAYRELPGRAALVELASTLLIPLDLAIPVVLGLVADQLGLAAALLLLLAQPVGLLVVSAATRAPADADPAREAETEE